MSKAYAFGHAIDQSGVDALSRLLGTRVKSLYTAALSVQVEACERRLLAPHFSLVVAPGTWVVIENDWDDTSKEHLDYHLLSARLSDVPKDIKIGAGRFPAAIAYPHSSLDLDFVSSPLTSIRIHEHHIEGTQESVRYDRALVFRYAGGEAFALAPQNSIAGLLEVKLAANEIEELERSYECRIEIRRGHVTGA